MVSEAHSTAFPNVFKPLEVLVVTNSPFGHVTFHNLAALPPRRVSVLFEIEKL
jgi:hypothetical protein